MTSLKSSSPRNTSNACYCIIPAAGTGSRFSEADGSAKPKQYQTIKGRTVLDITIGKFIENMHIEAVFVALNADDQYWAQSEYFSHKKVISVTGGETRTESVNLALQAIVNARSTDAWVLVHDAARPCVAPQTIERLIKLCRKHQRGGLLATRVSDTVKRENINSDPPQVSETLDRSELWLAHTPQLFPMGHLQAAMDYCKEFDISITDEASAIEAFLKSDEAAASAIAPMLVRDEKTNIKITEPGDLALAAAILNTQSSSGSANDY